MTPAKPDVKLLLKVAIHPKAAYRKKLTEGGTAAFSAMRSVARSFGRQGWAQVLDEVINATLI